MDSAEDIRIISLCSGYGGLDLGLARALPGVRVVASVEIEAYAAANLVAKTEKGLLDPAPIWTDVKTFPGSLFRGKVHGVTAGYPCQPFSVAGLRRGVEDERHLWPHIQRLVEAVRPLFVYLENVPGHVTQGLDVVVSDLHALGYVVEAGIFSAAEVGAPHQRERLFILGVVDTTSIAEREPTDQGEPIAARRETWLESLCGGEYLADSQSIGRREGRTESGREQGRFDAFQCGSEGVADADREGRPQQERTLREEWRRALDGGEGMGHTDRSTVRLKSGWRHGACWSRAAFPVGPGEEQHEWEAPRLAQPGLGGPASRDSCRVDRLRLAGNGVVPAQAELAFRTLASRFI